jgi:16S rRNA (adenine1518-N6/adenine1519-N6)-dimethyltransferase
VKKQKFIDKGSRKPQQEQNTPRGGKWASKFEDALVKGGKGDVLAKKALGQHFLNDENIAQRIADLVDEGMEHVVEIGPGMGVMTKYLYPRFGERLLCLEIDGESVEYLGKQDWAQGLQVWHGDFLQAKNEVWVKPGMKMALVGNYPYNISTQIVFQMLECGVMVSQFAGMFQKEVAERLTAGEGNKDYGITSVLLQAYYDCKYEFTVHEGSFNPPPKVKSGVIDCRLKVKLPTCDYGALKLIVKTAFAQRRKTLGNALKSLTTSRPGFELPEGWAQKRAEQLSVEAYLFLADCWTKNG